MSHDAFICGIDSVSDTVGESDSAKHSLSLALNVSLTVSDTLDICDMTHSHVLNYSFMH